VIRSGDYWAHKHAVSRRKKWTVVSQWGLLWRPINSLERLQFQLMCLNIFSYQTVVIQSTYYLEVAWIWPKLCVFYSTEPTFLPLTTRCEVCIEHDTLHGRWVRNPFLKNEEPSNMYWEERYERGVITVLQVLNVHAHAKTYYQLW
jgi:hypothetical protein